jgi:hypothetical protein
MSCEQLPDTNMYEPTDKMAGQKALATRPSFWILRASHAQQRGDSRPQELGVWYTWQGEDHLGGWPVQVDCTIS